jgi:hypothetical protein
MALTIDVHQINVSVYLGRKTCSVRSTDIDREPVPGFTRIPLRPVGLGNFAFCKACRASVRIAQRVYSSALACLRTRCLSQSVQEW